MNGTRNPEDAASALSEIQLRQGQVIDAVSIPVWYWWAVAASMVVIGAVVDYRHHPLVLGLGIAAAVLVIAGLTVAMILGTYRRVRIRDTELLGPQGALAIVATVWLVVGLTIGLAFTLRAIGSHLPGTISTAVGGVALVIIGPFLMRYLRRIMLDRRAGLN